MKWNWKIVLVAVAIIVMAIDAFLNPSRRFVDALFSLIGLSYLTKEYFSKHHHHRF